VTTWVLFDWGNTLMRDFPGFGGKMKDWGRLEVVPGARQALHQLHGQVGLALATQADDSAALARVDLDAFIKRIYCSRALAISKSSPEFYRHILADLRVPADRAVMVGDSIQEDVVPAREAGLRAIWFNEHTAEVRTGQHLATLHHLDHLPGLLVAWGILNRK